MTADGRDQKTRHTQVGEWVFELRVRSQQVSLGQRNTSGLVLHPSVEKFQLAAEGLQLATQVRAGAIDGKQQDARALNVAQKPRPQALARVSTLDQPRQVGQDKTLALGPLHNPQVRLQGRKGVVGNFGTGRRKPRQQRGFARVGEAHQPDVRQQL